MLTNYITRPRFLILRRENKMRNNLSGPDLRIPIRINILRTPYLLPDYKYEVLSKIYTM